MRSVDYFSIAYGTVCRKELGSMGEWHSVASYLHVMALHASVLITVC